MVVIYDDKDQEVDRVIVVATCRNAEAGRESAVTIHVSRANIRRNKGGILKSARIVLGTLITRDLLGKNSIAAVDATTNAITNATTNATVKATKTIIPKRIRLTPSKTCLIA